MKNIWMIDDSGIDLYLQKELMLKQGFGEIFTRFYTVSEALEALDQTVSRAELKMPDLILLDIQLPGKNGFDFLEDYKKLHSRISHAPLLFILSSSINREDLKKLAEHELVDGLLKKPLDVSELVKQLNARKQY
jgi:CheY-like chemotaxis protein